LGIISSQSISISINIGIGIGYDKECITSPERDKELTVGWNCNSGITNTKQPTIRRYLLLRLKNLNFIPTCATWSLQNAGDWLAPAPIRRRTGKWQHEQEQPYCHKVGKFAEDLGSVGYYKLSKTQLVIVFPNFSARRQSSSPTSELSPRVTRQVHR
jgi:hypothetical protein